VSVRGLLRRSKLHHDSHECEGNADLREYRPPCRAKEIGMGTKEGGGLSTARAYFFYSVSSRPSKKVEGRFVL